MNITTNKTISIKRIILYLIEILLFYAIHDSEFIVIVPYETKPIITIPITAFIAIYEKAEISIIIGAINGLLTDISIGSIFGLNALILCIICFITAKIFNSVYNNKTNHFFIYIVITTIILLIISYISFIFSSYEFNTQYFINLYMPNIIYTILISPIFYIINKKIRFKVR